MDERFKRFRYLMQQVETVASERLQDCKFAEHAGVTFTDEIKGKIARIELFVQRIRHRNEAINELVDSVDVRQAQAVDEFLKEGLQLSVDPLAEVIGGSQNFFDKDNWQPELEKLLTDVESELGLTHKKKTPKFESAD